MENYNDSKNKGLSIMIVLNRIFKGIISITIFLIVLETLLQISGLVYLRSKYKAKNPGVLKDGSLCIMFIGDSWTQGADAAPRPGYVPLTIEKLRQIFPDRDIQGYNFAWGSTNSSQAIHQFLDHYHKIKPDILVVMAGANDGWNTQDIVIANKRINNELLGNNKNLKAIKFSEYITNFFKKLKTIKLYYIFSYNIVYKSKEKKIPLPDNEYAAGYHKIFNDTRDREKAREYLINNYKEGITDYNDLYNLMLHNFSGDINKILEYLKNRNMLKLRLIKECIDIKRNESYLARYPKILEENLAGLKSLCDQEGIIMILENYPHLISNNLNKTLDEIAKKINVIYIDHYKYFKKKVSYEEWNKIMTLSHVNYKGHEYMADNLTTILNDIILKQFKIQAAKNTAHN